MRTKIRKIGNSLGNVIPAAFAKQLHIMKGSFMDIDVKDGRAILTPIKINKSLFKLTETELVNGLNPHTVHADEVIPVSSVEFG